MVDEQIISNLNLELSDEIVGPYPVLDHKVYKVPELSKGKLQIYIMEYGTEGEPIHEDTNLVYSTRGYFHVSNKFLKEKNKCTIYNYIAQKLDVKLSNILSKDYKSLCN